LAVAVDGSGSADSDGTVAGYGWDFGDGATATGVTASHTYAAAGTYAVKLTVTDDDGATGVVTRQVSVTAPAPPADPAVVAADAFERQVTGGWGAAETGGAWAIAGGTANAAVAGGVGSLTVAPSKTVGASLPVSARDVSASVDVVLQKAPTGGGSYVNVAVRRIGTSDYRARLWFASTGTVQLSVSRVVSGAETVLKTVNLPAKYVAGSVLRVRLEAVGAGTTTLQAKAWPVTAAEPAGWLVGATDDTAVLQAPGGLYLLGYVSGSATASQVVTVDNLHLTAAPAAG
jgi:PKD repeat protein